MLSTGRRSFLGPAYAAAVALCAVLCAGSPDGLDIGAPPPLLGASRAASSCEFRGTPRADAKRSNQPEDLSVCDLLSPTGVSPTATSARLTLTNIRKKPIIARGIKNAERVDEFLFI
jgi:hypothetical protein